MADETPTTFNLHLDPELDGLLLEIPVDDALLLCLFPVKYLRYLGYCILGVDGHIALAFDGDEIGEEDDLSAGVYYFVRDSEEDVLEHAIDPEAMTLGRASETTNTRANFREIVAERDVACVFTDTDEESCRGIHIVPFSKGDAWLCQIVESRVAEDDDNVSDLDDINDIRNGMLVSNVVHPLIDRKKLVILKTPNLVLKRSDIPPRTNTAPLIGNVKVSINPRYTLQWIMGNERQRRNVPNNQDAAFKEGTRKPKPSPLLLHYNYGVAAMKWWGKGPEHLLTARKRPIAAPLGPVRNKHDRSPTVEKLSDARSTINFHGGSRSTQQDIDAEREAEAEHLILTFYANTAAARERRAQHQRELEERTSDWQTNVGRALST
ncbi:hypothetical protein C8R47DRAFT_1133084 [Mycena vitilis]|nr:hypothetical protein C8R47DRAFT_1133084 [Mycena vitilis]